MLAGFQGAQYAPWFPKGVWHFTSAEAWLDGTAQAAAKYKGGAIRWTIDQITVLPRSESEAAAMYRVNHWDGEGKPPVQALFLETWRRQADGHWYLVRHTAEKAGPRPAE